MVPLVQVVINVLADLGNALDLTCVLSTEESRPCVPNIDLSEVWRVLVGRLYRWR